MKVLDVVDGRNLLALLATVLRESRLSSPRLLVIGYGAGRFHLVESVECVDGNYRRSSAAQFHPPLMIGRGKNVVMQRHGHVLLREVEGPFDEVTVHDVLVPLHFCLSIFIEIISSIFKQSNFL